MWWLVRGFVLLFCAEIIAIPNKTYRYLLNNTIHIINIDIDKFKQDETINLTGWFPDYHSLAVCYLVDKNDTDIRLVLMIDEDWEPTQNRYSDLRITHIVSNKCEINFG